MFLKGSIISFICLIWFIIYDRRERRRKNTPPEPVCPLENDEGKYISKEEADELMREYQETCQSVDALLEKQERCERIARERSERLGTDYDMELTEVLKETFAEEG